MNLVIRDGHHAFFYGDCIYFSMSLNSDVYKYKITLL